jgi:hypothetical protein
LPDLWASIPTIAQAIEVSRAVLRGANDQDINQELPSTMQQGLSFLAANEVGNFDAQALAIASPKLFVRAVNPQEG